MNTEHQAKRISIEFTPEQQLALRELREKIDRDEKDEILAMGRELRRKQQSAEAELNRTAALLRSERPPNDREPAAIARAELCRLENLVDANPTIATLNRIAESLGKQLVIGLQDKVGT